jgi:hypothetical protein
MPRVREGFAWVSTPSRRIALSIGLGTKRFTNKGNSAMKGLLMGAGTQRGLRLT